MKAPPKRKGNPREYRCQGAARRRLNESPSKKGREMRMVWASTSASAQGLNESPSEKEGKSWWVSSLSVWAVYLNESPSEKEGKFQNLERKRREYGAPQ